MRRVCAGLTWLSQLLYELEDPNITHIPLKCDNMAAIYLASNLVFHERNKRIEFDCHFVRKKLQESLISLYHVTTDHQSASILTKSLHPSQHCEAMSKLHLISLPPA